jgi:molecular chaperone HscB
MAAARVVPDDVSARVAGGRSTTVLPSKCHACDRPMDLPSVCTGCHQLYPADGVSYFSLFGLPQAFDIDPQELRRRYLQLSREVHPDRGGDAGVSDELRLRLSAQANHAYEVLGDPALRAEYLLELSGGNSAAQDKTVPPDVLSETLMLREEIDDAKRSGNAAALDPIANQVRSSFDRRLAEISAVARRLPGDEPLRGELRLKLNALKYYQRMLEQL